MNRPLTTRRDALRALTAFGAAAPFALNLAQVGAAAAANGPSDYKALVCIFLQGGNDSNNLLLATDTDSWSRYWLARNKGTDPIALMPPGTPSVAVGQTSTITNRRVSATDNPEYWGGVLPIVPRIPKAVPGKTGAPARTFAVHPLLPGVRNLFNSGRLAGLANVGTLLSPLTKSDYLKGPNSTVPIPTRLFSHNDQQAAWQSGHVDGATAGWGGEMGDAVMQAGNAAGVDFTSFTTAGASLFPAGHTAKAYRVKVGTGGAGAETINILQKTGSYNNSPLLLRAMSDTLLQNDATGSALGEAYAAAMRHSKDTAAQFNAAVGTVTIAPPGAFTDPLSGKTSSNSLADQLQAVAETIASHAVFGINRQVFFVQLGGFDCSMLRLTMP